MKLSAALKILAELRDDQIVVTTMAAAREWSRLSEHPLDLHHVPSAMGHAPGIGLGLAMACPEREVFVLNGDGGMLMNLGALVTVAASGATNFTLVLAENGIYEVTGGQAVAGCGRVDFAAMAKAAGFRTSLAFDDLAAWKAAAPGLLALPGPRFVTLKVEPQLDDYRLPVPKDTPQRLRRLREHLIQTN
jgi:sulfopyruvate decarboxylase subunit beta